MIDWTGERYLPEVGGQIELEHIHRYKVALRVASGKRVLDIACGEGYGSNMLSEVAKDVIGVDISEEAVTHAAEKYVKSNLKFLTGSCSGIPVEDKSIDLIVSYETIEHHDLHEEMLEEFVRVLAPDGTVIISSPDKHMYSDVPSYSNPYHIKELYSHEFNKLMCSYFKNVKSFGQRVLYGSLVISENEVGQISYKDIQDLTGSEFSPLYNIIMASNSSEVLPDVPAGILECDVLQTEVVIGLQTEINSLRAECDDRLRERDTAVSQCENLNNQMDEMIQSHSWKITGPLRWFREKFRF